MKFVEKKKLHLTMNSLKLQTISSTNYPEKVAIWTSVTNKNDANNAPTVLLIHPNRRYKVDAQAMYLDNLPSTVAIVSMDEFGEFWQERDTLDFYTTRINNVLNVYLNTNAPDERLSLIIDDAASLADVNFFLQNGTELNLTALTWTGTSFIYCTTSANKQDDMMTFAAGSEELTKLKVFPNPSSTHVFFNMERVTGGTYTLNISNLAGQLLSSEQKQVVTGTNLRFTYDVESLASGCYLYSVSGNGETHNGKLMVAH